MPIKRLFVEKKPEYAVEAQHLCNDLKINLQLEGLIGLRILHRYDTENIEDRIYEDAMTTIYSEPPVDNIYEEQFPLKADEIVFGMEYLPGQYDQRAESLIQCINLLDSQAKPRVQVAKMIALKGDFSDDEIMRIKNYCINQVDSREAELKKPESLEMVYEIPKNIEILDGFTKLDDKGIEEVWKSLGLAMTSADLKHTQKYFAEIEDRDPTITEIRVLDTYWSDHCRHTTFLTEFDQVEIEKEGFAEAISSTYKDYIEDRKDVYGPKSTRPIHLMDMALMAMKKLRKDGLLKDMEVSEEINACSIVVPVDVDGQVEDWLVMFKNETHNHPTEIEPFGGAATCLGGAIRDPLSGRSYVYQAMRVTGAADPRTPIEKTLEGKLPQQKIVTESAAGYSSYGNQIGLATGLVKEIYHPGYVAKRMEIGAVIAAAPKKNVKRESSLPGDCIILLGGRTGRDGIGGATGSSKKHNLTSITTCGAEVQKGNPPTERKIQRLFRHDEVSQMIKKCNDFGAGGVSVAIGELADGLTINLDLVTKKYEGLDGTELAISESQERMAVVLDPKDVDAFIEWSAKENLEARHVATVCQEKRLKMEWKGQTIVDLSREFLDTNGAKSSTDVYVEAPENTSYFEKINQKVHTKIQKDGLSPMVKDTLGHLNSCSQKGLIERFDSTIGASSVLLPFGGRSQSTPSDVMVAKIPVIKGETNTATAMSYGYDPELTSWSPYHGAFYAVVDSVAKIVAAGGDYKRIYLTFQEYFKRLGNDPKRWGQPTAALLGAYAAQKSLKLAAIGGKDSMSGTFQDMDVPPTLVSFAVCPTSASDILSNDLKESGHALYLLKLPVDKMYLPDIDAMVKNYSWLFEAIRSKKVYSAMAIPRGGAIEAATKMSFGNEIGIQFDTEALEALFMPFYGSILLEADLDIVQQENLISLGKTIDEAEIRFDGQGLNQKNFTIKELRTIWEEPLEKIYPTQAIAYSGVLDRATKIQSPYVAKEKIAKPQVFIPVFPGTNCEYDTARSFQRAGAKTCEVLYRNLTPSMSEDSVEAFVKGINNSQMIMIPGGFSAGDEPEGSGKFIATVFRNPRISQAVMELLEKRDGLVLGICNGFQALIKLGLLPDGQIKAMTDVSPTLTYNTIGRHVSRMVSTKIMSNKSPWLTKVKTGDIYEIAVSHGEGRFIAEENQIRRLFENGQVVTTYVNAKGYPSMSIDDNPNGSMYAVEGLISPNGRVLGKMGHSERIGKNIAKNIYGKKDQKLFEAGVEYYQ